MVLFPMEPGEMNQITANERACISQRHAETGPTPSKTIAGPDLGRGPVVPSAGGNEVVNITRAGPGLRVG